MTPVSECLICQKPLGQGTKDAQIPFCHTCRNCTECGAPLGPTECRLVVEEADETLKLEGAAEYTIKHSRCSTLHRKNGDEDPSVLVKQSYLNYLNACRLLIEPNMDLSEETNEKDAEVKCHQAPIVSMSFEQKFITLRRMQACVAHLALATRAKMKDVQATLDKKERAKWEAAQKEAQTSARPKSGPPDEKELILAEFQRKNGLNDRASALKILKEREKAINGFIKIGMAEKVATEAVDKMLREQGRMK
jgi:hypothetical protein